MSLNPPNQVAKSTSNQIQIHDRMQKEEIKEKKWEEKQRINRQITT